MTGVLGFCIAVVGIFLAAMVKALGTFAVIGGGLLLGALIALAFVGVVVAALAIGLLAGVTGLALGLMVPAFVLALVLAPLLIPLYLLVRLLRTGRARRTAAAPAYPT